MFFSWPLFLPHPTLNQQHNAFLTTPPYFTLDNINKTSFQWCRVQCHIGLWAVVWLKLLNTATLWVCICQLCRLVKKDGGAHVASVVYGVSFFSSSLRGQEKCCIYLNIYNNKRSFNNTIRTSEVRGRHSLHLLLNSSVTFFMGHGTVLLQLSHMSQLFSSSWVAMFTVKHLKDWSRTEKHAYFYWSLLLLIPLYYLTMATPWVATVKWK